MLTLCPAVTGAHLHAKGFPAGQNGTEKISNARFNARGFLKNFWRGLCEKTADFTSNLTTDCAENADFCRKETQCGGAATERRKFQLAIPCPAFRPAVGTIRCARSGLSGMSRA